MKRNREPARLFGIKQTARRVGVPESWLRQQVLQGDVPGVKIGARWKCCVDAVNAALVAMASKAPEAQQQPGGNDGTV